MLAGWGQNELVASPLHAAVDEVTVVDFETCATMLAHFPWPGTHAIVCCDAVWLTQAGPCFCFSALPEPYKLVLELV